MRRTSTDGHDGERLKQFGGQRARAPGALIDLAHISQCDPRRLVIDEPDPYL
jgi:hypothetical protein